MRVLYDGEKYRSLWRPLYALAFGAVFAGVALKPLFSGKEIGVGWLAISVSFAGFGLWMAFSTIRFYSRLPIDVTLDGSIVQIRERSGERVSVAAMQFDSVSYAYEGSDGTLSLTAEARAWTFPVSEREAEDIISALTLLNSGIRVERKKVTSGC